MQSLPISTPRISAISFVILAAGNMPPKPGLAPWLSLISMARIEIFRDDIEELRFRRSDHLSRSAAEVTRTDLPDQVAAALVMHRHAAFARVVQGAGHLTASIHRFHRAAAQRSETHGRDVDDRFGPKGLLAPAMPAQKFRAWDVELGIEIVIARECGPLRGKAECLTIR